MAVAAFSQGFRIHTAAGTISNVTVGDGTTAPYRTRVNAIHVISTGAGGATTIRADGATGTIIWQASSGTDATTIIAFAKPQDISNLSVSVLGANTEVIVFV